MSRLIGLLFIYVILAGCNDKSYKYVDSKGATHQIIAENDNQAYIEAVSKFEISKAINKKTSKAMGLPEDPPIYFDLYNSRGVKIIADVNEDSISRASNVRVEKSNVAAPIEKAIKNSIYSDTAKLKSAPIKVTKARFYQEEYSNYKNVSLTFKNVSNKKVNAIKFRWYGENAFGEPADMSGFVDGWGGGFTDKIISPGRSMTLQWSVLSRDGKKILVAYPTEAMFADGTKWKIE